MTATMFVDSRAERIVASSEAERRRAETALLVAQAQQAQRLTDAELEERRTVNRRADREAVRARRAAARARLWSRIPVVVSGVLWASVITAPITIAWEAQRAFAETTLHLGGWAWLFPLAVEAGAWVCAFEAHRRVRAGLSAGAFPTWMWLLATVAATINLMHGIADYDVLVGCCLAVLSLLGVVLHHVRQSADRTALSADRMVLTRWLRYPRLSFTAWSIRIARGTAITCDQAWATAWIDRYGVSPDSSRRDRRIAKTITAHHRKTDRKRARNGELAVLGGVILPLQLPAFGVSQQASRETANAQSSTPCGTGETMIVQHKHDSKTNELLVKVREAISRGELDRQPSARAILTMFGGATDTAGTVRDILRQGVTA